MMKNNSHQLPDFDSIVGDDLARTVLTDLNLMPSAWGVPEDEQRRILYRRLTIRAASNLEDPNWPAYQNQGVVTFSADAFGSGQLSRDQLLATLLHEVGHWVNVLPYADIFIVEMKKSGADQSTKPANRDELYADDYARHCGYSDHLKTCLYLLMAARQSFRINSTRERIARLEANEQPLLLNLAPLPN